jgi:DNA-binding response OmpR family regulator
VKILIAEDNPVFQTMLRSILRKWGYEVEAVADGGKAWDALRREDSPQLAILDWMMPGWSGVEICRKLRAPVQERYTYVILLTGRTESEDLVEGMEAGADDYLTKPFKPQELRVRLRAGQRLLDLQRELVLAREALRWEASHDGLTGILNRVAVLELLQHEIMHAATE